MQLRATSFVVHPADQAVTGKGKYLASIQDVNGDGRLDLVPHVDTTALALTGDAAVAVLEGRTLTGQAIRGTDSVRLVP
ncbi:MAG: hypothetical protein FJ398_00165 [Verrucomicrobia bacterium]|nr:hypothetical protein [Verrucomicrobiota bacterium]